jgi:predicted RNA-binding protein with PUA-like domain
MNYWLLKSEPTSYGIDHLKRDKKTLWTGVRNYQARNFLQAMKAGDGVLIYHSNCDVTGVYGVGKVTKAAVADPTALNKSDYHFDPKSTVYKPIWYAPEISFIKKFEEPFTLFQIKADNELQNMFVAQRGSRLSVMPVEQEHFEKIINKGK